MLGVLLNTRKLANGVLIGMGFNITDDGVVKLLTLYMDATQSKLVFIYRILVCYRFYSFCAHRYRTTASELILEA